MPASRDIGNIGDETALGLKVATFASGTAMLFVQSTAPTGWTKSTTHNDKALRVVSGTAGSGGSVAFTSAFASQAVSGTVGSTTLTTNQIPSHTHTGTTSTTGAHTHNSFSYLPSDNLNINGALRQFVDSSLVTATQTSSAGNHNHTFTTDATGGGGSHNHSFTGTAINLAVQYVDTIIATKD